MKKLRSLFLLVVLLGTASCQKTPQVMLIGGFSTSQIDSLATEKEKQSIFTSSQMISNELYKIVDTRAVAVEDGKRYAFDKQIKKASLIFIAIGFMDFKPYLTIDPSSHCFLVDEEGCEKQLELLHYNVYHSLDAIRETNAQCPLYVTNIFPFYDFEEPEDKLYRTFLKTIDSALQTAIIDHNAHFVSLTTAKDESEALSRVQTYL